MNNQIRKYSLRKFKGVGLALAAIGVMSTSTIHVNANELVSNDVVVIETTEATPEVEEELILDDVSSSEDKQKTSENEDGETLEAIQTEDEKERFDGCNCQGVHTCGLVGIVGAVVESVSDNNSGNVAASSSTTTDHTFTGKRPENVVTEIEKQVFETAFSSEKTDMYTTPYKIDTTKKLPSDQVIVDESQLWSKTFDVKKTEGLTIRDMLLSHGPDVTRTTTSGSTTTKEVVGQINSAYSSRDVEMLSGWSIDDRLTSHARVIRAVNNANWATLQPNVDTEEEAELTRYIITPYMYADAKAAYLRAKSDHDKAVANNESLSTEYLSRYQDMVENFSSLTRRYNLFMGTDTTVNTSKRDSVTDQAAYRKVKTNIDQILAEMPKEYKQHVGHLIYYSDANSPYYAYTYSVDGRIYLNVANMSTTELSGMAWTLYHEIGHIIDGHSFMSKTDTLSDLTFHKRENLTAFSKRADFLKVDKTAFDGRKETKENFADAIASYVVRHMGYYQPLDVGTAESNKIIDEYIEKVILPTISPKSINKHDLTKIKVASPFGPVKDVVTEKVETRSTPIPFKVVERWDDSIPTGETRIHQQGQDGVTEEKTTIQYVNGVEKSRKVTTTTKSEAVDHIILNGSKEVVSVNVTTLKAGKETRYDSNLDVGKTRVVESRDGFVETTTTKRIVDGKLVVNTEDTRVERPHNEITYVGTRPVVSERSETLQFGRDVVYDNTLPVGETTIIPGKEGRRLITTTKSLVNDQITTTTSERIDVQPVNEIVKIGSKSVVTENRSVIKHKEVIEYDESLNTGETRRVEGKDGLAITTSTTYLENGIRKTSTHTSTTPAVDTRLIIGVKPVVTTTTEVIPKSVVRQASDELFVGEEKVVEGRDGLRKITETKYYDQSTNEIKTTTHREVADAVNTIVYYGTKQRVEEKVEETVIEENTEETVTEEKVEESTTEDTVIKNKVDESTNEDTTSEETVIENKVEESTSEEKVKETVIENKVEESTSEDTTSEETKEETIIEDKSEENTVNTEHDKENTVTENTTEDEVEESSEETIVEDKSAENTEKDTENTVTENKIKEKVEETTFNDKVEENTTEESTEESTVEENVVAVPKVAPTVNEKPEGIVPMINDKSRVAPTVDEKPEGIVPPEVTAKPQVAPTVDEKPEGVVPTETSNENVTPLVEKTNEVLTNDPVIEEKTNEVLNYKLETTKSNEDEKEVARVTEDVTINTKRDENDKETIEPEVNMNVDNTVVDLISETKDETKSTSKSESKVDKKSETKRDLPEQKVIEPTITKESNVKQATDTKSIERQESTSNENTQQTRKSDNLPATAYKNDSNYGAALVTLLVATGILTSSAGLSLLKKFK